MIKCEVKNFQLKTSNYIFTVNLFVFWDPNSDSESGSGETIISAFEDPIKSGSGDPIESRQSLESRCTALVYGTEHHECEFKLKFFSGYVDVKN
jgi:hypothetical protein